MSVPLSWATTTPAGGEWATTFTLQDDDGAVMDVTGKTFELVARVSTRDSGTPLIRISSVAANAQGLIVVDVDAGTVQTIVFAGAVPATLATRVLATALWMDVGQDDATCLVDGTVFIRPTAAP